MVILKGGEEEMAVRLYCRHICMFHHSQRWTQTAYSDSNDLSCLLILVHSSSWPFIFLPPWASGKMELACVVVCLCVCMAFAFPTVWSVQAGILDNRFIICEKLISKHIKELKWIHVTWPFIISVSKILILIAWNDFIHVITERWPSECVVKCVNELIISQQIFRARNSIM